MELAKTVYKQAIDEILQSNCLRFSFARDAANFVGDEKMEKIYSIIDLITNRYR